MTLFAIRAKLQVLELQNLQHCSPLLQADIQSIRNRFEQFFSPSPQANEATLAACTNPTFKLQRLPSNTPESDCKKIQQLFMYAAESTVILPQTDMNMSTDEDDFFAFQREDDTRLHFRNNTKIELEALQYLQDKRKDIQMVNLYPVVKGMFLQYNTSLTSSAPAERMFSFASIVNNPRRNASSDSLFQKLVLLKANRH